VSVYADESDTQPQVCVEFITHTVQMFQEK